MRRLVEAIRLLHPSPRPAPDPVPDFTPAKPAGVPLWLKLVLVIGGGGAVVVFAYVAIIAGMVAQTNANSEPPGQPFVSPPPAPPPAQIPFDPGGTWTVTQRDSQQQWIFVLTLSGAGAVVEYPAFTENGRWNYDPGQRMLTVREPDGSVMFSIRVAEWHQDHFHGQLTMYGGPAGGTTGVNIRRG